jgi:uncharacterized spore protein YtfJ
MSSSLFEVVLNLVLVSDVVAAPGHGAEEQVSVCLPVMTSGSGRGLGRGEGRGSGGGSGRGGQPRVAVAQVGF